MRTFKTLTLLALLVVISAFAVNTIGIVKEGGYEIEDEASDFYLRNVDKEMISLDDFPEAKGFIIIFTCNTCPFSVANEDRIIEIDKKYKKLGYPVIAINPNDPSINPEDGFIEMQKRAKAKGFTFPYVQDEYQEIYPMYGATKTPHTYLLQKNKEGVPIVKYIGGIDNNARDSSAATQHYLKNALNALIAGKEIAVKETKAIGCSIKTK